LSSRPAGRLRLPPRAAGGEAEARRFYANTLGVREVPKPPNLARGAGVLFDGRAASRASTSA
jgi:hypothetical protein